MTIKFLWIIYFFIAVGFVQFGLLLMESSINNIREDIKIKKHKIKVYLASIGFGFFVYTMFLLEIRGVLENLILIYSILLFWFWIRGKYSEINAIEYQLKESVRNSL